MAWWKIILTSSPSLPPRGLIQPVSDSRSLMWRGGSFFSSFLLIPFGFLCRSKITSQ